LENLILADVGCGLGLAG